MRSYPTNSPEAAGRLVALAMLADGHLSREEMLCVERLGLYEDLGMGPQQIQLCVLSLCEDLMFTRQLAWADACKLDSWTLDSMLAEIDDPALRRKVLQACVAVVEADHTVSDGESLLLVSAVEQWDMQREMLEPAAH